MKTPARSRLLAAALLALFALGGCLHLTQPAAGGGAPVVPAPAPPTMQSVTSALTLTESQLAQIEPLLKQLEQTYQEREAKRAVAATAAAGMRERLAPVFTDAQKKSYVVQDLLGTYNDHAYMQAQLGITRLRPGKSGSNQEGPGFILETANPWKDTMPDVMRMQNGTRVTRADQWPVRRKEILELFEREVYGRIPANVPKVTWEVTNTTQGDNGGIPTITRTLIGRVDNSVYPAITVNIQASYTIPANSTGPVPLFLSFGGGAQQAYARGWGSGSIQPGSIQADSGGNSLRQGIIGLTNKGQPRKPEDWGALRAWGWGVSKLLDYFEAHPEAGVNPRGVTIEGVSRYGKAALVTMAFDERVGSALVASSGEGGAKLHRHDFGEAVENLTASSEYHWMSASFLKYGAAEATFGKKDAGDLPVDSHQLIALCAPRPVFISYGVEAAGDPKWVGAPGSYMAGILASPVYELLGKKGYGVNPADYITAPMPAVQQLVGGELAWRQHEGGHTSGPNIVPFLDWIAAYIKAPTLRQ